MTSQAQQARKYAPIAFDLSVNNAELFWKSNHFVDEAGEIVKPDVVSMRKGTLSVIFPDGSIINY